MKPNLSQSPEDRLLDELLHEQNQGPDDAFLQQIEAAVDAGVPVLTKRPPSRLPARLAIAAAVMLSAGSVVWWQTQRHREAVVAANESRAAKEKAKAAQELLDLNKAIRDQEEKVEERRKVLATIVRTKGIIYKGTDSFYGQAGVNEDQGAQNALQTYHQLEQEKMQLETQISSLKKYEGDQQDAKDQVENTIKQQEAMLNLANDRLKSVGAMKDAPREEAIKRGLDAQDYVEAKREFETDQSKLQDMKLRQIGISSSVGSELANNDKVIVQSVREMKARAVLPSLASNNADASLPLTAAEGGQVGGKMLRNLKTIPDVRLASEQNTGDRYGSFIDQPWKTSASDPLTTFSIDVDTASYGNVRRMIREGREIPRDAVRIEECINAFSYRYAPPKGDAAFSVGAALAVCPWAPEHQLVRIAIKGREIDAAKRPASNLVFLIDVSGSMQSPDRLPLLKQSMATLVNQLDERDRVAIVVYAGSEGVALPSTRLDAEGRATVLQKLAKLEAGGSTNGGAGIKRAYEIAMQQKIDGGVNRVILATDGDFNVGVTGQSSLVALVKERAKSGVNLTVLGYGSGNLNDSMMDAITRDGNGNYFYIDSEREGRKVFLQNLTGTLVTIAKDVKIQIEFNPAKVGGYRLIGYANRVLRNEDFKNDKVDAGDIGAGHTVTAFYELTPPGAAGGTDDLKYQTTPPIPAGSNEWLTVKLRHKHPEGDASSLTEFPLTGEAAALDKTDTDFQFATAVTLFGMKLRGMDEVRETPWEKVMELAKTGLADDTNEDRAEFVGLLRKLGGVLETAEEKDGPNVRTVRHEDGSRSAFVRRPDSREVDRKNFSKDGELKMKIVYRMDAEGNPLSSRIYDGKNNLMFKVSYGYRKSVGMLVEERIFDAQVDYKDPDSGRATPTQRIIYNYDTQGKRSEPIIYNMLPGKTVEELFGIKSTSLDENTFLQGILPPPPAEVMPGNRR